MITERRQVIFSNDAVREAVRLFAALHPDKMPHGQVRRVWTATEPELQLFVQIEQIGARKLHELRFGQGEIAAFLILFCRKNKIPLPRSSEKFLEIENGSLSLVITKQILTETLTRT
ncbi:hypothetical protein [Skermanella pratensis]|uniref:hypothetical protein n=1 Tax=Skermanella pratensis TaxID=2233999 RepID=UPI0013011488|nr:hypothetical protein [Skermanella pratensis]